MTMTTTFQPGTKVTYQFSSQKRGNAIVTTASAKQRNTIETLARAGRGDFIAIRTEREGTRLVHVSTLVPRS